MIVAAGARNYLVEHFSIEIIIPLAENHAYASRDSGNAYIVNLARFGLSRYADSEQSPFRSPFVLREDGHPLQPHALHADIRIGTGKFSHWNDSLYFSSTDGTDPFKNGRSYVFAGKIPKSRLVAHLHSIALVGLALLSLSGRRRAEAIPRQRSWLELPLLAAALALSFALQLYPTAIRYGITPDSGSYTWNIDNPTGAVRPPGYTLFMEAVSDARQVGDHIQALTSQGKMNQLLNEPGREPLRKVVAAQKAFLAAALVVAFLGLATFLPSTLAAAICLGTGYFLDKSGISLLAARSFWVGTTAVLLGISVLALLARRYAISRTAAVAAGVTITLYPVLRMLFDVRMVPEGLDFVLSEALTMATQLLLVAFLCCFLSMRKPVWLYLAAVAFALSTWMRPAAIFGLGVIALALIAALSFRPRPRMAVVLGALVLSVLLMQAPSLYNRAVFGSKDNGLPMLSWSLACFALEVVRPEDVKLMPNPTAVRFFNDALAEREKRLVQHDAASGPAWTRLGLNMYLVAFPVAERIAATDSLSPAVGDVLFQFAVPIYKARAPELIAIWWESFRHAITDGTRLSQGQPLWWTLVGLLILVCLVRSLMVVAGSILLLGHFGHLLIVSVFDAPISRYVHATEYMVVMGLSLVIAGAACHFAPVRSYLARIQT